MDNSRNAHSNGAKNLEPDESLLRLARNGDKAAMERVLDMCAWLPRSAARSFHVPGADAEDLVQEGMIGLYRAVMGFDESRSVKFLYFAKLCVERQVQTAVKSAFRGKHSPLKDYAELTYGGEFAEASSAQPLEVLISREDREAARALMSRSLSAFESRALSLFIRGYTYAEIAERLERPLKSIDNALARVRKKLGKGVEER